MTEPLSKLLRKDVVWEFSSEQIKAFGTLKRMVTETPVLQFFDPKLNVRVGVDSSQSGFWAILEQEHPKNVWKPVAFASQSFSNAEKNYAPIEKECLSVVFATNRFHEYCYGRYFDVLNDHKPLQGILSKSLVNAPPRIQRFLLRLQHYEFDFHYVPGNKIFVSDCLSRAHLDESKPEIPENDHNQHLFQIFL